MTFKLTRALGSMPSPIQKSPYFWCKVSKFGSMTLLRNSRVLSFVSFYGVAMVVIV
jgi:hypothetical protein